jgi:hypothetical protein
MEPELHTGLVAAQGKFGTSAAAAVFRSRPFSEKSAITKPNVLGKGGFEAAFLFSGVSSHLFESATSRHHTGLNRLRRKIGTCVRAGA